MQEKKGCVFCRGELEYKLADGVVLAINDDGDLRITTPMINEYRGIGDRMSKRLAERMGERTPSANGSMVMEAGKLFDRCPTCGRELGKDAQRPAPVVNVRLPQPRRVGGVHA